MPLVRSRAETLAAGDRTVDAATIAELMQAAMHGALAVFEVLCNSWRGEPTQYPRRTRQSSPATRESRPRPDPSRETRREPWRAKIISWRSASATS